MIGDTAALTGPDVGGEAGSATLLTPLISENEKVANPFGCDAVNAIVTGSVFLVT